MPDGLRLGSTGPTSSAISLKKGPLGLGTSGLATTAEALSWTKAPSEIFVVRRKEKGYP